MLLTSWSFRRSLRPADLIRLLVKDGGGPGFSIEPSYATVGAVLPSQCCRDCHGCCSGMPKVQKGLKKAKTTARRTRGSARWGLGTRSKLSCGSESGVKRALPPVGLEPGTGVMAGRYLDHLKSYAIGYETYDNRLKHVRWPRKLALHPSRMFVEP